MTSEPIRDPRWRAIQTRDARADGRFVYAVKTTGVYCRPHCASRQPKPENVIFYDTPKLAEAGGFRACRRCRPQDSARVDTRTERARLVAELCRFIESSTRVPSLAELAQRAGFSNSYTHRLFKTLTGITPQAYARLHRTRRVRKALGKTPRITDAIYDAGYASSGRFYAESALTLGMTPSEYRSGAERLAIRFAAGTCSLGEILVAATARGVCAILLGDDPQALVADLERRFPQARLVAGDASFEGLVARVVALAERPWHSPDLPLDIQGSLFQRRVWQALTRIPAGKKLSYSELAQFMGAPNSSRAVASACAANPLAIAIPCHRVVRRDGGLAGYRWGIERKRELLAREEQATPRELLPER